MKSCWFWSPLNRNTAWTGHQSHDKHGSVAHSDGRWGKPLISLMCVPLDCRRKQECLEKTHTDAGKRFKFHPDPETNPFNQTRYQNLTLCMHESSMFTYQNINSTSKTLFSLLFSRLSNSTAQCRDCGLMNDGNDMASWMKRSGLSGVFLFFLYHLGSSSSILLPTSDISLTVLLDC